MLRRGPISTDIALSLEQGLSKRYDPAAQNRP
jgi:hypothetical protein